MGERVSLLQCGKRSVQPESLVNLVIRAILAAHFHRQFFHARQQPLLHPGMSTKSVAQCGYIISGTGERSYNRESPGHLVRFIFLTRKRLDGGTGRKAKSNIFLRVTPPQFGIISQGNGAGRGEGCVCSNGTGTWCFVPWVPGSHNIHSGLSLGSHLYSYHLWRVRPDRGQDLLMNKPLHSPAN